MTETQTINKLLAKQPIASQQVNMFYL